MFTDAERRARLARRHGLGAAHRHPGLAAATAAMTVWHATEPSSVHLAIHARSANVALAEVENALYGERSLVRQLAMRRTLFAFPRELYAPALAGAGARTAAMTRTQLVGMVRDAGVTDVGDWIDGVERDVVQLLSDGQARSARQVAEAVPTLAQRVERGSGKWAARVPLGATALTLLAARGVIIRAENGGDWRRSAATWTTPRHWLGAEVAIPTAREGYAALVAAWLRTFGPGTEADLVWWFGATKTAIRRALGDVAAEQVPLSAGRVGWVAAEDADADREDAGAWAALVPILDPTTMGWRERDFYLESEDTPYLFDSVGNAAATAWVDGRIVGTWVQDDAGRVGLVLRRRVPVSRRRLLDAEAERLTALLAGQRISSPYAAALAAGKRLP